ENTVGFGLEIGEVAIGAVIDRQRFAVLILVRCECIFFFAAAVEIMVLIALCLPRRFPFDLGIARVEQRILGFRRCCRRFFRLGTGTLGHPYFIGHFALGGK